MTWEMFGLLRLPDAASQYRHHTDDRRYFR